MKRYLRWPKLAWSRGLVQAGVVGVAGALSACGRSGPLVGPVLTHPIEGIYDVTIHFTTQTTRGPCVPPGPDLYCFTTVSVDITKTGSLIIDDASATSGAAELDVTLDYDGRSHTVVPGAPMPAVDAAGRLSVQQLYAAGFFVTMNGTLVNTTIEGMIGSRYSIMQSHGGTFRAVRRP